MLQIDLIEEPNLKSFTQKASTYWVRTGERIQTYSYNLPKQSKYEMRGPFAKIYVVYVDDVAPYSLKDSSIFNGQQHHETT